MSQPSITQLHQFLLDHFNTEELKTLCFNLFVEYEDLGGEGRSDKARELVRLMKRHGKMEHFCAILAQARPSAYQQTFQTTTPFPPLPGGKPQRNSRQIFLSHAHQDADFAQRLAADLRASGHSVWIAPDSILIGEDWPDAIDRGLDESGVIVVTLTPHALNSYWVRKETSTARLLEAQKQIRFILLDVADCDPPSAWKTYQYAPFRGDYQVGLQALLRWLGGKSISEHPPEATTRRPVSTAPRIEARDRQPGDAAEAATTNENRDRRVHAKTGIELIRIPAGPFLYGEDKQTIDLPDFWIGRYPVTNAQYKRFLDANPKQRVPYANDDWAKPYNWDQSRRDFPAGKGDHPVVLVSWHDVLAFCDWAGLILPSEQQWDKAARGTDGRIYPWGDEWVDGRANTSEAGTGGTTPVGRYSPLSDSPYGCADMAGNVWEWTASWYDASQSGRVLRGGSWNDLRRFARVAFRNLNSPDFANYYFGFRVAAPVDPGS